MSNWWVFLSYPPILLLLCHVFVDLMADLVGPEITVVPLMIGIAIYISSHIMPCALLAFLSAPHPVVTPSRP